MLKSLTIIIIALWFGLSGCSQNSKYVLFKNKEYNSFYASHKHEGPIIKLRADSADKPYFYHIQSNDLIAVQYVNVSEKLLEIIVKSAGISQQQAGGSQGGTSQGAGGFSYAVDEQGFLIIPIIGRVYVKGLTILELRKNLEEKFKEFVNEPVIDVHVASMKVYLLGEVGRPGVIILPEERTSLVEVLLLGGSFTQASNIKRVQIIRNNTSNPQVIWINFQDLTILQRKEIIVHANDVIYVEPRGIQLITREILPYTALISLISLLSSIVILRSYIK